MHLRLVAAAAALALAAVPASGHATEVGIDPGAPVWSGTVPTAPWDAVPTTGVDWVRINFRLDSWTTLDADWFATYDAIVDAYLARGIQVYGLISDEAVGVTAPLDSPEFVGGYVDAALGIVAHFKDRVRVYELFNEPNDWAGGTQARLSAYWFARLLQDTYLAIKHDGGHDADPCWRDVQLVSGPLFSFDGNPSDSYLAETYDAGRNQLAWDYTHMVTGSYPLDGIGYHMYVAQGDTDSLADVQAGMAANLGALWAVVSANEPDGAATAKRIWVSEFGWRADLVGPDSQADRVAAGFQALDDFGKVAVGFYFQLQDFPGNEWGVFAGGALDATTRRPAADRLAQVAAANRPVRWAHISAVTPITLPPGGAADVFVTVTNKSALTWGAGSSFRLGAAPGCPGAAATNEIAWEPAIGYATSPVDARLYLLTDVPPGATVDLPVRVRAPATDGEYRFAARMVQEGAAWFGTTGAATITVMTGAPLPDAGPAAPDGGGADAGLGADGSGAGGCGCQTSERSGHERLPLTGFFMGLLSVSAVAFFSCKTRRALGDNRQSCQPSSAIAPVAGRNTPKSGSVRSTAASWSKRKSNAID